MSLLFFYWNIFFYLFLPCLGRGGYFTFLVLQCLQRFLQSQSLKCHCIWLQVVTSPPNGTIPLIISDLYWLSMLAFISIAGALFSWQWDKENCLPTLPTWQKRDCTFYRPGNGEVSVLLPNYTLLVRSLRSWGLTLLSLRGSLLAPANCTVSFAMLFLELRNVIHLMPLDFFSYSEITLRLSCHFQCQAAFLLLGDTNQLQKETFGGEKWAAIQKPRIPTCKKNPHSNLR